MPSSHQFADREDSVPEVSTNDPPNDRPQNKRPKYTRTRGVGCETCRRRKKKCAGIDAIFKTCLGCRKNGLLCLPWGSEHPQYPANGVETSRSRPSESMQEGANANARTTNSSFVREQSDVVGPLALPEHTREVANFVTTHEPLPVPGIFQQDTEASYAGLEVPMTPNTQAIWMALIQYTEPGIPMEDEAIRRKDGRGRVSGPADPGYGMLGTGVSLATTPVSTDETLTMEYALDPRTDLRKHPHTQHLLDLYLEIADCWLPTFPPGSNNPIRTAVAGLHDSPASICVRSALASAYLRCVNGGKEVREGSRTLGVDLERLFVDTAISSISANPPDLSLSNKLWCIIDLQLYYFTHSSARQGMEIMKMAEDIIHQEFGESPELVMSLLYRQQTFGARIFALGDISRCILDRGKRCVFDLIGKNDENPPIPHAMALGAYDSTWVSGNAWLGMPLSIGVDLAAVVDLVADMKDAEQTYGARIPTKHTEGFRDRGFAIEGRIRRKDFAGERGDGDRDGEPIGVVLGDLWKATALTILYQSVFHYGPLHPHLRDALAEMRRTLSIAFQHSFRTPAPTHLPHLFGYLSCPVFFAGTLAIAPQDRQWVRRMLERLGPEQAWRDNAALLEGVWREMDDTGWAVDWYAYMVEHERWAGFY
ncbi:hypothetical protein NliqN6_1277 [Naganishia liquefaciens]|uniref:Zn(2)-C6 fungal-type domain-containing protein n=1 Tax=Naganishia liquefaciens TaxID=104408 RepID=A0A8H3TPM0_9TREE|nr:hypothetical protein NliqN6_1277 [Naganishia liquefaciens]